MRDALSQSLVTLAQKNPKVVVLTGDHGYALFDEYRSRFPRQYINAGIAEQNMVGMAAGLARAGYFPIVYGLSAFIPIRVLEQIKLDVCHDNLPVIFLGDGAGFVYSTLGTSHQSTEDIAATRAIPHLAIYSPADRHEMSAVMRLASNTKLPSYVRIGKGDLGDVHIDTLLKINLGELCLLRKGSPKITFIATGSMVKTALDLAEYFEHASVWSAPVIKPFDESKLLKCVASSEFVVSFEEHSVYGGLGGMLAEILSAQQAVRLLRIGVKDRFSHGCGSYAYLLKEHGLDPDGIRDQINTFLSPLI